jgi:hypothetical protein
MKHQVIHIAPHQAGKILGIMYFILGLLAALVLVGTGGFGSDRKGMLMFAVSAPFLYGVMGYVFSALGALTYNVLAKYVGGFQITVIDAEPKTP